MGSRIKEEKELEPDMEKDLTDPVSPAGSTVGLWRTCHQLQPHGRPVLSNSGKALIVPNSSQSLGLSNSAKRLDPTGKKKAVKQVTDRADFDEEVAQIMTSVVNEVNELGATPLFTAAKGNIDVVIPFLRYMPKDLYAEESFWI
ncbi:hypothetical protein DY000_02043588 [Brassica cretica]|uniref:Uncharacterized protein n=1 Tax=Brassica cretica TaxID=69181 RepID=A0ABQ7B4Y7_BRACR|nr:hypothetical protein DY000_02043588 [Brassica cretica]